MKTPRPISNLIDHFERLPGIGPKTAQRLVFYLLHFPKEELQSFADSLVALKTNTVLCSVCKNVDETDPCSICSDPRRDSGVIAVVASPMDVFALERAGFKGKYHVLHGIIDPLNNIGPDELFINHLIKRLENTEYSWDNFVEVILATSTSMEGESTALYIQKLIRDRGLREDQVKITRLARGLPVGGDIEYADDLTLSKALDGRVGF